MKKILITLFLVLNLFTVNAKANDQLIGHILTETLKDTKIETVEILEKELAKIAHAYSLEMISTLEKYLPSILEGIAADLRLKSDHKYKCKLLENGGMKDGCI